MCCHYYGNNKYNIADYNVNAKFKQQKKLALKPNMDQERFLWLFFFFLKK
jgi:hypothetical protein